MPDVVLDGPLLEPPREGALDVLLEAEVRRAQLGPVLAPYAGVHEVGHGGANVHCGMAWRRGASHHWAL